MKHFFILGSNPTLSLAELAAAFAETEKIKFTFLNNGCLLVDFASEIDAKKTIKQLGGAIKIGVIRQQIEGYCQQKIIDSALEIITAKKISGKLPFGFSCYGKNNLNSKVLGMKIKKGLTERVGSVRWVISREKTLSSVVVEQNKLTSKGIELVMIFDGATVYLGETQAVQPFKELSFRDYGRPNRDDRSGMLPPKLAQIMVNLAQIKPADILLDPFCGSGTVLTEALLLGYKNLIGSDISPKAIEDTKKNSQWITANWRLGISRLKLRQHDARFISQIIEQETIDAIVTEPYLGPQRGRHDLEQTKKELQELYEKALRQFFSILKSNGKIVMIWPVFHEKQALSFLNIDIGKFKKIPPLPPFLANNRSLKITARNSIIYHRPEQKVGREIVILKK